MPDLRHRARRAGMLLSFEGADGVEVEAKDEVLEALLEAWSPGDWNFDVLGPPQRRREDGGASGGARRGLWCKLYALRCAGSWGVGDLAALARLLQEAGTRGYDFVQINPLFLTPGGPHFGPYGPSSRLYWNPLYLSLPSVPEWSTMPASWRQEMNERGEALEGAGELDYPTLLSLRLEAMEGIWRRFGEANVARRAAWAQWKRDSGRRLLLLGAFQSLSRAYPGEEGWRAWPERYQDPHGPAVQDWILDHQDEVDFQGFLQFEMDRQLAEVQALSREFGLSLGLMHDLPVASAAGGFDLWCFPKAFVSGVHMGCPPDPLGPLGQDWQMPPLDPKALAEGEGLGYWRAILETALRHGGGLRLDHALGLVRQYWIPEGQAPSEGAYVRYPTELLLGALAELRGEAVLVGEDLGTVDPALPLWLEEQEILGMSVALMDLPEAGFVGPPAPGKGLLLATTHDLLPLVGWFLGRDLEIRASLGLPVPAQDWEERCQRRRALLQALASSDYWDREACPLGSLPPVNSRARPPEGAYLGELVRSLHRWMLDSRDGLVALGLDDLVLEREPVNLPGVHPKVWPSWTRRMATELEDVLREIPGTNR